MLTKVPRSQVPHVCLRSPGFIPWRASWDTHVLWRLPEPSTTLGRCKVGVELAMEVVMGKKAVCRGRRAGCALCP